jgi:hypothetical protein
MKILIEVAQNLNFTWKLEEPQKKINGGKSTRMAPGLAELQVHSRKKSRCGV